jgi:predicted PurR-regulated permease PerM
MALLMCVVDWTGWTKPLLVVLAYAVCQFLEGFVVVPRIVGDKVGLPAVWVLVALMVGGEVFGFLGVLLAVPVAAVVKIFVVRGLARYRASALYRGSLPPPAPPPPPAFASDHDHVLGVMPSDSEDE